MGSFSYPSDATERELKFILYYKTQSLLSQEVRRLIEAGLEGTEDREYVEGDQVGWGRQGWAPGPSRAEDHAGQQG